MSSSAPAPRLVAVDTSLVAAAAITSVVVVVGNVRGAAGGVLIAAGSAVALYIGVRRRELAVSARVLGAVFVVLAVVAIWRAPLGSHDMWSYAMYGRILEHYHANPYHVLPAHFAHDPVLRMVGTGWRHTVCVYGPLFLGVAAGVSRLGGTHLLALRMGFQIPVALAVLISLWVVARGGARRQSVALVGLQPVLWCSIVNGGHNDVYVGLATVVALGLLRRERPTQAGAVLAVGALVKLTTLLVLPVVLVVILLRYGMRATLRTIATVGAILVAGLAVEPGSVTAAANVTAGVITRASLWRLIVDAGFIRSHPASTVALGVVAVMTALITLAVLLRRPIDLGSAATLAVVSFAVLGSYVLPWYIAWSLPVAALAARRDVRALVAVQAALLGIAYQVGNGRAADRALGGTLTTVLPVLTAATLIVITVVVLVRSGVTREDEAEHGGRGGIEQQPSALGFRERTSERETDAAPRVVATAPRKDELGVS